MDDCIFCKIISGEIPSTKIVETDHVLGFMDAFPLSRGHCLFIPKRHCEKMHNAPDEALQEIPILIKKVATAVGLTNYNILQNNGKIAHQAVNHVHFHLIPKTESNGLGIIWNSKEGLDQEGFASKIKDGLFY